MPLIPGCSRKVFGKNIKHGIKKGQSHPQAVAIAFETKRRTCRK